MLTASFPTIRTARDDDAAGIIALIFEVFCEYPGCVLNVPEEEPELLGVRSAFSAKGGDFWVIEDGTAIVACLGYVQHSSFEWELKKLYVRREARRRGLGTALLRRAESLARDRAVTRISLWSDSRFVEGHAFYLAQGFQATGRQRELGDLSNTTEFEFEKAL